MTLESIAVSVRSRTNSTVQLVVTCDGKGVTLTTRRWTSKGEPREYTYPALPPKRWWSEHVAEIHPGDRTALHKFLGLS